MGGTSFEIELRRSNRVLTVPADRSALDVIRGTAPNVAYSCQQGFCGTCRTRVISGDVEHRDRVLTDRERTDTMTICVSRRARRADRARPVALADGDQVDDEHQRFARLDRAARTAVAVGQVRRDGQPAGVRLPACRRSHRPSP